ncbi:hypothetical protein ACSBR2_004331 [Camellia fascicularis]
MQVYWSSLFILPKKIIGDIESILRSFLWSGVELKKHSAKIAWKYICRHKNEGGLGFKDLEIWNKAAIAKHVWYLFSGGDCSMWCQWVKSYLLKGRSFWSVKIPSDPSWVWRKILSLRHLIYPLIKFKIGNGENVFLWHDNWHPLGSLWRRFGPRILYDTNLPDSTKEWISSTPSSLLPSPGSFDTPVWSLTANGTFSIQLAWDCWRDKGPKVSWSKLIWGPPLIPRVSFIAWLAINERLNTSDRLQTFGLVSNPCCPFCQDPEENHSHLFFRSTSGNSLKVVILKLSFLCTVYHIWMERNSRIFSKVFKPEEVVTNSIIQMVRGRLLSMENVKTSAGDNWFLEKWNLPYKIMQQHHAITDGRRISGVMMNPKSSPKLKWSNRGLSDVYGAFKYTVYLVLLRNHVSCGPSDVRFYMEWSDMLYCGPSVRRSYIVCLLFLLLYDVRYGVGSFNLWDIRQVYLLVRRCGVFSYSAVTGGCCQCVYLMEWRGSDCLLHRFERQLEGCMPTPTGCVGRNRCCGGAMLDAGFLFVQSPSPFQDMAFVQTNWLVLILFFLELQM